MSSHQLGAVAGDVFYSFDELATLLSVPMEQHLLVTSAQQLEEIAHESKLPIHNENGKTGLHFENAGELVKQFSATVDAPEKRHPLPAWLENCDVAWAKTLVEMYRANFNWPAALAPAQGEFLRALVSATAPRRIVEIGCFTGVSSIWMASALEQIGSDGHIHSVDFFNSIWPGPQVPYRFLANPLAYARQSAQDAGLSERITFHQSDSHAMGQKLGQVLDRPIDLLFIDGDHTISGCSRDFLLYYPHVARGGLIVLHDIYPKGCGWEGPRYVLDTFVKNSPDFEVLETSSNTGPEDSGRYGIAVIRKVGTRRSWTTAQRRKLWWRTARDLGGAGVQKVQARRNGQDASEISLRQRVDNLSQVRNAGKRS